MAFSIIGLGLVAIASYLFLRNKGGDSIPAIDPLDEVIARNLKLQSEQFQNRISAISSAQTRLEQINQKIPELQAFAANTTKAGNFDVQLQNERDQLNANNLISILSKERTQILNRLEELGV